jgi:hypothetical protein
MILFYHFGYAQTQPTNESPFSDSSQALQFSIGDNFALHSFQGATISYKHHLQRLTALRFGLTVSFGGSTNDNTLSSSDNGTLTNGSTQTLDQTNFHVQFGGQKVWYVEGPTAVFFYFGSGPYLVMSRSTQAQESSPLPPVSPTTKSTSETTSNEWSAGVSGLAGVECFAARSISLHAEYGVNFAYSWTKVESTSKSIPPSSTSKVESKINSWQFSSPGVTFGVSVYF